MGSSYPYRPSFWLGDKGYRYGSSSYGAGDSDPFRQDMQVSAMQPYWGRMQAVTNGTDFIRYYAPTYLPKEPREPEDAYETRVQRSVLSPYTVRLIDNAAGLILRRPINIEGDDFWLDWSENVDGLGSSLNEFARRALISAITYGHSGILVDFPQDSGVTTLFEERQLGRRPYFNNVDAPDIWGWRQESQLPSSPLTQVRIHEWSTVPSGEYGQRRVERIRVIRPDSYEVFQRQGDSYGMESGETTTDTDEYIGRVESGPLPFNQVPFVPMYTNRVGMLTSSPPLIDIANLNITHYQRQADLIHALHIAAMPILVLEGWDDAEDATAVGVNYGLITTPGNKVYYVNADSGSFDAQQEELRQLEMQMSHLGISKLLGQKYVAESADAKRIDQAQANSVLSIISMELESALNQAYAFAARYLGVEPPRITLDRDFDFYRLIGQDISVIGQLRTEGALSNETYLKILKSGEIIPDSVDIDDELAEVNRLQEEMKAEQEAQQQAQLRMQQEAAQNRPNAANS
jgi:hypothetical protein